MDEVEPNRRFVALLLDICVEDEVASAFRLGPESHFSRVALRCRPRTFELPMIGESDLVPDVTAADAARNFADLLDAIEHRGERFTIVRRGRAIAQLEPMHRGRGVDAKALLRRHRPDADWSSDLDEVRDLIGIDERS